MEHFEISLMWNVSCLEKVTLHTYAYVYTKSIHYLPLSILCMC